MKTEEQLNNKRIFKTLFAEKDFAFLNTYDNDIKNLDIQIETQTNKKNLLIQLITNLNETLPSLSGPESETYKTLFIEANNLCNLSDQNITILNNSQTYLKKIYQQVIDLLVSTESNTVESIDYINLKNALDDYSFRYNESKNIVFLNDIKIDNFINSPTYKTYTSMYGVLSSIVNHVQQQNHSSSTNKHSEYDFSTVQNNKTLRVSEKDNKVYLPYSVSEIKAYLEQYPNQYLAPESVIKKEFILPLDYYMKHPVLARFRETYSLIKDREGKSIIEALKASIEYMFKYNLNPVIIAACKTQSQLESYMHCLETNTLSNFNDFEIIFEVNPI